MKTVTSVSGGQSSAYIAANYPSDYLVFALVTTEDKSCQHPDPYLRKLASEKIGREFVGTLEDDVILRTMVELEQYLQQEIDWVAGEPFEKIIQRKKMLPNIAARFCTVEMKLRPLHRWWKEKIAEPVNMQIGFRAGEEGRATRMLERANSDGLLEFKDVIGKHNNGNNKWATQAWQKPAFPMIENGIKKDTVVHFWRDKPVTFALHNNCVGCFHRNAMMLRKVAEEHGNKFDWFIQQEKEINGRWKRDSTYEKIKNHRLQLTLEWEDFNACDSGHCGL